MVKVLFVCHGNICRSPMAKYVFKKIICDMKLDHLFSCDSRGVSDVCQGDSMDLRSAKILKKYGYPFDNHCAKKILLEDLLTYDYILIMDELNQKHLYQMFNRNIQHGKVFKLLFFVPNYQRSDIADPYYTLDFETCYEDIYKGINEFLRFLNSKNDEHK